MFASTVVASRGGDVCMTDELLHDRDVHPGIEEIRNTRPA
jgi:hypothetical protein